MGKIWHSCIGNGQLMRYHHIININRAIIFYVLSLQPHLNSEDEMWDMLIMSYGIFLSGWV